MLCKNLMYVSKCKSSAVTDSVLDELEEIRLYNEKAAISGALLHIEGYDQSYFAQFIEGPDEAVEELYEKISADSRHEDVQLVYNTTSGNRFFEKWTMGLISSNPKSNSDALFTESEVNDLLEKLERSSTNDIIEIMQEMYLVGS